MNRSIVGLSDQPTEKRKKIYHAAEKNLKKKPDLHRQFCFRTPLRAIYTQSIYIRRRPIIWRMSTAKYIQSLASERLKKKISNVRQKKQEKKTIA